MTDYRHKYLKYKSKYLKLKSKNQIMAGGSNDILINPEIIKKIDAMAEQEFKNLKSIQLKDLSGLSLRVYERNKTKIAPVTFTPADISKYIDEICLQCCSAFSCAYLDYYDNKYGDITKNPLKDLILNFGTNKNKIKVAFYDNYNNKNKNIKQYFEIKLPIKFLDFIDKLFDHFDEVGLGGYPDNGGIDGIVYDQNNDIYLVQTWS